MLIVLTHAAGVQDNTISFSVPLTDFACTNVAVTAKLSRNHLLAMAALVVVFSPNVPHSSLPCLEHTRPVPTEQVLDDVMWVSDDLTPFLFPSP